MLYMKVLKMIKRRYDHGNYYLYHHFVSSSLLLLNMQPIELHANRHMNIPRNRTSNYQTTKRLQVTSDNRFRRVLITKQFKMAGEPIPRRNNPENFKKIPKSPVYKREKKNTKVTNTTLAQKCSKCYLSLVQKCKTRRSEEDTTRSRLVLTIYRLS